jgi:hypothetical protein
MEAYTLTWKSIVYKKLTQALLFYPDITFRAYSDNLKSHRSRSGVVIGQTISVYFYTSVAGN